MPSSWTEVFTSTERTLYGVFTEVKTLRKKIKRIRGTHITSKEPEWIAGSAHPSRFAAEAEAKKVAFFANTKIVKRGRAYILFMRDKPIGE